MITELTNDIWDIWRLAHLMVDGKNIAFLTVDPTESLLQAYRPDHLLWRFGHAAPQIKFQINSPSCYSG